jgi:hypothetical protein
VTYQNRCKRCDRGTSLAEATASSHQRAPLPIPERLGRMLMMRRGLVVAALAFVALGCHRTPRPPASPSPSLAPNTSVSSPFDPIADEWTSMRVGSAGRLAVGWRVFRRLSRRLDRATALTMLKDPRPAVRAWGAQYVLERDLADIGSLRPLLHDDAPVSTQRGSFPRRSRPGRRNTA